VFTSFTTVYADEDGWEDLARAELLVDTSTNKRAACYLYYDQGSDRLYLRDDKNKIWLGGYSPGSAYVIENSQAILDCSLSSVSGGGSSLSIVWSIAFKHAFTGTRDLYLKVEDDAGARQRWESMGVCTITPAPQDTLPPTGVVRIDGDAPFTNTPNVSLMLSAQDEPGGSGVSLMQFSDDGTVWSTPEAYTIIKNWTLAADDGTKTVYARFSDAAGNWSQAALDAIVLDTVAPQLSVSSPQEGEIF